MFPFLERLHQRYASHGLTVYGVSQDSANVSRSFARRVGITFPILIDDDDYAVSRAFEVTATPTVFLMQPDGSVAHTTMGFFKDSVNELAGAVATAVGQPAEPVFTDADTDVPRFVPG
jgi:peroxiredoxin